MKQIGILPAGCQIDSRAVLFANDEVIYYASTLSIYIFSAKTFLLEKVVNVSPRMIAGKVWTYIMSLHMYRLFLFNT